MRTATSEMITQLDRTDGAAFRLFIYVGSFGSSRYLCTDKRTIDGVDLHGELLSVGDIYEGVNQLGDVTIEVLDNAENRDSIRLGGYCTLYFWPVDGGIWGDKITLFNGTISDPITISGGKIRFDTISYANKHDQIIGKPISVDGYPGADPDVIGLIAPELYGSHKDHECLPIDAGSLTKLSADLSATETTAAYGSDVSTFPLTGTTIQIDSEQITYAYTIDGSSTFATLVRGVNGTTAVAHDKGAVVAEIQTYYDYLVANHPVKSISNIKVDLVLQDGVDVTALTSDGGVAKIRFTARPTLLKSVDIEVDDTIAVVDNIGVNDSIGVNSPSITTLPHDTISTVGAGQTFPTTYGTTTTIHSDWIPWGGGTTFTTYECNILLINAKRVAVKTLNGNWLYIVGTASTDGATTSGVITATLTSNPSEDRVTWYVLWGTGTSTWQRQSHVRTLTGVPIYVNRTGSASKSGAASKTGTVELTGNSVAETVIGTLITCDVEGWEDDSYGTITGTPFALIERPDHVATHLLRQYGGAQINQTFDAGFDDFIGDKLAIRITSQRRVLELLKDIAAQVGGLAHYSSGRWRFIKRPDSSPTADITLTDPEIIRLDNGASSIVESFVGLRKLRNRHIWRTGLQPNGGWLSTSIKDNAVSQYIYGGLREVAVDLPFIPDAAQAQALIDWRSLREGNAIRPVLTVDVLLPALLAEIGDIVTVESTKQNITVTGELLAIRNNHTGRLRLTIESAA